MTFYVSVISALVIAALAIFVNQFADRFDEEINSCGLGTYRDGACQCIHPYVGTHCETVDCGYGRLINSLFESSLITTPNPDSDIGCACESKFWGYSCANCTSRYPSDCSGPCLDNYYGARCDIICKESTASDAVGYAHEQAGGTFNFYIESQGICLYDGSVRCNPGRAGSHCEFQCLDCEYGSCNLNDGSCDCFAGYYGELCNMTCPGRCSGNNGLCESDGTCACDAGFTGDDCSLTCCIRDGGTSMGRVHGSCDPTGGCLCDDGWTGPNCDCNDLFTCSDRGTCSNVSGTCVCEEQFQGARCDMCSDLKVGPFCQYDRYQCPSREQQNGEFVAVNTRGDYRCKCKAGFTGNTCEECSPFAYPKNGTEMCSFVIPASLCNRGTVKDTYQGTGIMCNCEQNFDPATDCASCKTHYFGNDCDIECGVLCTNSGGICESSGCTCPKGKSSVNGVCEFCGGDTDCQNGDCENGRCQCDPGFYGDDCSISAPSFENKVCNGYQSDLYFESADCETDAECLDLNHENLANQQVAYRANQYNRVDQTFCHRLDTPLEIKNTVGCCVDSNADGKCDAANLLDDEATCAGEMVYDICNQRTLEGEVNIFDWCTSQSLGCTMNGACVDPVLCENRCDAGLNSSEWIEKWEVDHSQSMESVMNETWKFPIHFEDPYTVRSFYTGASLDDVCPAPTGYNFCRDALIPPDATVYNATHKFVDGWESMPSFHSCELQHHVLKAVNGTYLYNFNTPIWAGRIEMVSDSTQTAAFGRLGQDNASYYGETNHFIDSLLLFGRGDVEVIVYNYTTDSCVDLMKRSATNFLQCKQYAFYEFEYDWDDFCTWRDSVVGSGGFEQLCYDQSLVCAGCENWQEGCENLPLVSEFPFPMPDPCTPWSNTFCDDFLDITFRQTGTCAYTQCECHGYGVGGPACSLQCAVPQFTNSDSACGSGLDPPWGTCEPDRGAIAFGFEQGRCNCFNSGDPNLGCALVCTNNDECSRDIDTPFSFEAFNCSEYSDLVSFEPLEDPTSLLREKCNVNLRDSTCNYWRGRCECATPYTIFTLLNQSVYYNMGSYRVALMQGYEIDEYQPFTTYIQPTVNILEVVNENTLCWDPYKYPLTDSFVCHSDYAYKNTDTTFDEDLMRCKDYNIEDCGKIRNSSIVPSTSPCGSGILDQTLCMQNEEYIANTVTKTNRHRFFTTELGGCKTSLEICRNAQKPMYTWTEYRSEDQEYTHPRDPGGRFYVGCDSARWHQGQGFPTYAAATCNGGSMTVIPQTEVLNEFFTSCCKSVENSCRPKDVVTDLEPYLRITSDTWGKVCEDFEGYEVIRDIEECRAAVNMINLYDDKASFQRPVEDVGSVFMNEQGCYYGSGAVYHNSYPGVSYRHISQQTNGNDMICKRKNTVMGAQAIMSSLTCESGCAAVSYADLGYSSRYSQSSGGDGNIMQDCLMYSENVRYNQDKLLVGDSTNYLMWDLEGLRTTFGLELTTDLVNIRPNVLMSDIYVEKTIIVSLYELNKDVTLDLADNEDWQFVQDYEFDLKADKPPILTVDGVNYVAGGERTYRTYNMKWMQGSCGTTMSGTWFSMDGASNMEFHSPNTAQWCTNYCDSLGATHFTLNQITLTTSCSCSIDCSSFDFNSVFYQYETKYASYEIVDKVIPAKNRLELQGEWYSEDELPRNGLGKRIRKTQFEEWDGVECRNWDYIYDKPPRCERAMTREECIDSLTSVQQCNQFKDGICKIHCTTNGTDCCGGDHEAADPNWAGSFHISFDPFLYGTSVFLWQPKYEICSDVPSYVFVDDVACSGNYPQYSSVVDFLPGPNDNWYDVSRDVEDFSFNEHLMLDPTHPLFREDKKEECALRCKQIGATEFAIVYKWEHTEHPEERCRCNDREGCANVGPWPGTSGTGYYQPANFFANSQYTDPLRPDLGTLFTSVETYVIVDDCTPVEETVTFSCPEDYAEIKSDLEPFDDIMHYFVDRNTLIYNAATHGFLHSFPKHENADGYFKLFSQNAPHLMTQKCAYRKRIEIDAYKTRYLKIRAADLSGDYLHDSIVVRPLVTTADVVISTEKSGCVENNHEVGFYDLPMNITRKRQECFYSVLAVDEICTFGVLYGSGMGSVACSDACGSAFHIQNQDCYCAPGDCVARSPLAGAVSYMWKPDNCGFSLINEDATCSNIASVTASSIQECSDVCVTLGHTAFTVSPSDDAICMCCTDDGQALNPGTGNNVYRINPEMDFPEKFVMITDKSCEYYGHQTIMDEELCKRGANEFGGRPINIFENNVNGDCWSTQINSIASLGNLTDFESVFSVVECAKRCGKFRVKYTDTWTSETCEMNQYLLYQHVAADLNECKDMCSHDVECNYIRYDSGICFLYSDCGPGGSSAHKRERSLECSCNNLDGDCDFGVNGGSAFLPPDGYFTSNSGVEMSPRGCSLNAFTDEDIQIECENCICLEGDGVVTPQFVEVTAGTCVSNGHLHIGLRSRCFQAISELGYDMTLPPEGFSFSDLSNVAFVPGPLACTYSDRPHFGDGTADCSATNKCICQRQSLYKEVSGTCASNNLYAIQTLNDCLAAGIELLGISSYMTSATSTYRGCSNEQVQGLTFVTHISWSYDSATNPGFEEGTLYSGFPGTTLCRTQPYWTNDYYIIWGYENPVTEACADHGWSPITTQEDCERAVLSYGFEKGLHPVAVAGYTDVGAFDADVYSGCRYYVSGLAQYSATGNPDCVWWRPCFCRKPDAPITYTSEPKEYFPVMEVQPYVLSVESKYKVINSGESCQVGYIPVGNAECTDIKPLFAVLKYESDCSRICKPDVSECENDEICHCMSDTPVTVFDSNQSCAVCGGGQQFRVKSSFFNENGNTRSCIYSEDITCTTDSTGWTQYRINPDYRYNETFAKASFSGYCIDSIDIPGEYDNMLLHEVIGHCHRLCANRSYFAVNRGGCKCTASCEQPFESEYWDTFTYINKPTNVPLERAEFLTLWENRDLNIECYKDLEHTQWVDCEWIRALKHFARGASYRVGDCTHVGPGVGEGVESQIPCSGHGFLSAGTCACDYAEQLDLKDTGVGMTFELPTLTQTPFRGRGCDQMCPGYDLLNMESVCSGHGRCESDGRCACDQGYAGFKCHLECEKDASDLTCSGHGVCNIVHQPIRQDIDTTIRALDCNRSIPEILYLARDRVIQTENSIYHMYMLKFDLLVDIYTTSRDTIVTFTGGTGTHFTVIVNEGEVQENPEITVCRLSTIVREFDGYPMNIIDANGNFIAHEWNTTEQITLTAAAGTYTYYCTEHSEMSGQLIIEDCPDKITRNSTVDDFYISGTAIRQPWNTDSQYPYMACQDTISVQREQAVHPFLEATSEDVYINCSLLSGMLGTAYTVVCAECSCSYSRAVGHWTGYNCRTPAFGFLGEDGKTECPGMVDKVPCNGRGTCNWGSVNGLGDDIRVAANCFCGNPGLDTNYSIAPRNEAGDIMVHADSFGTPLYVDTVDKIEGTTSCPNGTIPLEPDECDYIKEGTLVQIGAKITTDQDYTLDEVNCAGFDLKTSTAVINRISASGMLVVEGLNQPFRCAEACFGHYRYKANGKIGTSTGVMFEELTGTFEENVQTCGFACMNRDREPITGTFTEFSLIGFSINEDGQCYCETNGPVILDSDWRYYEYVLPYTEIDGSGRCLLNNVLVYHNTNPSVEVNPGQTPEERVEMCARKCQLYRHLSDAVGFSYMETSAQCYCETLGSDCVLYNSKYRRFDFTLFDTFKLEEDTECKCGRNGGTDCFTSLSLPDVFPDVYTFTEPTTAYENFVCTRNGNHMCKPGEFILNNFLHNCDCKFGFTGPLCETSRMMCLFSGQETDGSICDCSTDGIPNPKNNPLGCCAYGMYWDQDRYAIFSPLQTFTGLPDNVFYQNALDMVCKSPPITSMQSPGDNAVQRQHNYVFAANDHELLATVPCNSATKASLYKPVFKYTTAATSTTDKIGSNLYIWADDTLAYFSDHNAKMQCFDHCTIDWDRENGLPPRGFMLKTFWIGNTDTSAFVGEENIIPWGFQCTCKGRQAYVSTDGMQETLGLAQPYLKLSGTVKPQSTKHEDKKCGGDAILVPAIKYASGRVVGTNCYAADAPWGTLPSGNFVTLEGRTVGLAQNSGECAERCQREGFDTFWVAPYQSEVYFMCIDPTDTSDGPTLSTEICSVHSKEDRLEACLKSCYMAGHRYLTWHSFGYTFEAQCQCFDTCTEVSDNDDDYYELEVPVTYTLPQTWDDGRESIIGDVYDIVYPKGTNDLECFQTDTKVLEHVDVLGLNRVSDGTGNVNEVGIPYSLEPEKLNIKAVHAENLGTQTNFQQCLTFCSQQREQESRINSVAFTPTYKTIEMVYAGLNPGIPLKRCWGSCTSDSDCEGDLLCANRDNGLNNPASMAGVYGCKEPEKTYNQWGATPLISGGTYPWHNCEVGCSFSGDCAAGTHCFIRNTGGGLQPVPGCDNSNIADFPQDINVCYYPTSDPNLDYSSVCAGEYDISAPGAVSSDKGYLYRNTFDCQCTEHDKNYECTTSSDRKTPRDTTGECIDGVLLGAALTEEEPFYNSDKIEECRARCLIQDENTKAFYVKNDWSCGCATGYCKLGLDTTYQAYDISEPFGESCDEKDGFIFSLAEGLYTEPFVTDKTLEDRPPNPITCNIESYLHIGTIMDSGECECPLYDFELMYADTQDYTDLGLSEFNDDWVKRYMHYSQLRRFLQNQYTITLTECKEACNEVPGCTEITHDGSECWGMITTPYFYNNIQVRDWEYTKVSDRECTGNLPNDRGSLQTIEECMGELAADATIPLALFSWGQESLSTYSCRIASAVDGSSGFSDNEYNPRYSNDCTGNTLSSDNNVRTTYAGYGETSGVVNGHKVPTWAMTMEGGYIQSATTTRYRKQLANNEINLYCPVGEVVKYNVAESNAHANPHYCMQECRKELLETTETEVLSRGDLLDGIFTCYCSFTISSSCTVQGPGSFPQYKVHRYSGPDTSIERMWSTRDPQIGNTQQCKCQGYYIYNGEAMSCPENTYKNSGHCTSSCTKCPLGRFSAVGSTLCEKCPAGRILNSDICEKCEVGKYASAVDFECKTCTKGRYNTKVGQGFCFGCPAGWFDNNEAEGLNCDMCSIGKSTENAVGSAKCTDCATGRFNSLIGQKECYDCLAGRFNGDTGATSISFCKACNPGHYQDTKGNFECKGCPEGRHTTLTARHECQDCDEGKYAPATGYVNCYPCLTGKKNPSKGQSSCKDCDVGRYQNEQGQRMCKRCGPSAVAVDPGASSCKACSGAKYKGIGIHCNDCPSAKPSSSYAYGSWGYLGGQNHYGRDMTCDSTVVNWLEDNHAKYDKEWQKNSAGKYVWDCKYLMSEDRGYGAWNRRPCWTGASHSCDKYACDNYDDCSGIWVKSDTVTFGAYQWCYPGGTVYPGSSWSKPNQNNDRSWD